MKIMKKISALVIAMVMVLAMALPAMAAYDVTINQNEKDKGTHTYGAYQIFKGNLNPTTGAIGDIQWGSGISEAGKTALGDAATYAAAMTEANAADKAVELAQYLTTPEKTGSDSIVGLEGGYYLIMDTTDPTGDPSSKTKYIMDVFTNKEVNVKSSVPSVEKKVQELNDSDDAPTLTNLQDGADYDIGDSIPYTVTATIGSGIANFEAYSFQFVDTMTKGLRLDTATGKEWDIKVGSKSIKSLFTLETGEADANGNLTYTWKATDIKAEIEDGSEVVLTYYAILGEDAVIGAAGNPNTVVLKFDNNPNNCGQGKPGGTTPEDKNIVFTYKITANKVDSEGDALEGAGFTLYKKEGTEWVLNVAEIKGVTTFEFTGKDAGVYRLEESTVPAGYNKADDVFFLVEATYDTESDDPKLKSLEVYASDEDGTKGDLLSDESDDATFTAIMNTGIVETNIVNNSGTELPSTGGIGTTIFYVIGGVLVVLAGIVLVTKRKSAE